MSETLKKDLGIRIYACKEAGWRRFGNLRGESRGWYFGGARAY